MFRTVLLVDEEFRAAAVGEYAFAYTVGYRHMPDGLNANERTSVLASVIIGTFHQSALWVQVA
jgi:hypothetical protein